MNRREHRVPRVRFALTLIASVALAPGFAAAERVPWSQGWSFGLSSGSVGVSGFEGDLRSRMNQSGWGVDIPPAYDPFFGFYWPGTAYPIDEDPGGAFSFRVDHMLSPGKVVALAYSTADLGGQTGYDGSQTLEITGSIRSMGALFLFGNDKILAGGGPTLDWLGSRKEPTSANQGPDESTSVGIGLDLVASYRPARYEMFFAGVVFKQHLGVSHEIGPYAVGSATFPASKVSPANTVLTVEIGLAQPGR